MSGEKAHTSNTPKQPLSSFFDVNDNLDLEKIGRELSVSAQDPTTFDLLCPKVFENLVF